MISCSKRRRNERRSATDRVCYSPCLHAVISFSGLNSVWQFLCQSMSAEYVKNFYDTVAAASAVGSPSEIAERCRVMDSVNIGADLLKTKVEAVAADCPILDTNYFRGVVSSINMCKFMLSEEGGGVNTTAIEFANRVVQEFNGKNSTDYQTQEENKLRLGVEEGVAALFLVANVLMFVQWARGKCGRGSAVRGMTGGYLYYENLNGGPQPPHTHVPGRYYVHRDLSVNEWECKDHQQRHERPDPDSEVQSLSIKVEEDTEDEGDQDSVEEPQPPSRSRHTRRLRKVIHLVPFYKSFVKIVNYHLPKFSGKEQLMLLEARRAIQQIQNIV